eukprot:c27799_g1_i1 orf=973-1677(-)
MVDCRSLIEFCKAFEQHRNMTNTLAITDPSAIQAAQQRYHHHHTRLKKQSSPSHLPFSPLCEQSSAAAVDVVILFLVLGACGFLFTPYFKYICWEAAEILPATFVLIAEVVYQAPIAYISGTLLMFVAVIGSWELYQYKSRRCNNPQCKGLRKATEFDIQLESEECIKASPAITEDLPWKGGVELGDDHKELEAELRRMAPPNGRTVLVFRAPCGCPAARLEVWGTRKPRKSKK